MAADTRPLPKPPDERGPLQWSVSIQGRRGKAATCRACMQTFSENEARVCRESDLRAGAERFLHLCCVPGGFHAQDEIQVPTGVDAAIAAAIAANRAPLADASADAMTDDTMPMDEDTQPSITGRDSWWATLSWEKVFKQPISTLIDVPQSLRSAFAERKQDILLDCLKPPNDSSERLIAWRKLTLFDALILNSRRTPDESQSESVTRRLSLADEGQWEELWFELTGGFQLRSRPVLSLEQRLQSQAARVRALALSGQPGRALRALKERPPAVRDASRLGEVRALYPPRLGPPPVTGPLPPDWCEEDFESLAAAIAKYLRRAPKFTAPGSLGSRLEHWCVMNCVSDGLMHAAKALAQLGLGLVPQEILDIHAVGEIMPISKPSAEGLRPLLLSSICRRIAMGAVARITRSAAQAACGSVQLGVGEGDGVAKGFHTMGALTRMDPQRVVVSVDVAMAHQSFSRCAGLVAISQEVPQLARPFAVWYGRDIHHFWRTEDGTAKEVISAMGADQGDPIAQQAFAVTLAKPVSDAFHSIQQHDPRAKIMLYADDIQLWLSPDAVPRALAALSESLAGVGLKIKSSKTKVFCPLPGCALPPAVAQYKVSSLKCLGCRLESDQDASQPVPQHHGCSDVDPLIVAAERVREVARSTASLHEHGLPRQISQSLLRFSAAGATQHIISTAPASAEALAACDSVIRDAWETVIGVKLSDEAWVLAQLPLREGGLAAGATQTVLPRASASFACTWSRTVDYVATSLGRSPEELLSHDTALAGQLKAAGDALVVAGLPAISAPWLDGAPPNRSLRQSRILRRISSHMRKQLLPTVDAFKASRFRSSAGPGASGFLMCPSDPDVIMDDDAFKVAVAFRLGGGLRRVDGSAGVCSLRSREGPCRSPLSHHHATTCACGGHIVRRHNRSARYLCGWLNDGRAESEALLEQRTLVPEGVMDITVGSGSEQLWIDVAIVSPTSSCARILRSRARIDGAAAKAEEKIKRSRYGSRCTPFVIESGGRPGASARALLMRFASHEPSIGQDISHVWQALSSIIQAETALGAIQAYGGTTALKSGTVEVFT